MRIDTIPQLIEALKGCKDNQAYLDVMKRADIPSSEFERYYHWSLENYTRNYIHQDAEFELVLACWEKGQESPIHDYSTSAAWVHPVSGKFVEETYMINPGNQLVQVSSRTLTPADYAFMGDQINIHRFRNSYENRSVSLHLYAGPVKEWNVYAPESGQVSEMDVWVTSQDRELA